MPVYTYRCPEGHEFDLMLPVDRRDETPRCSCTAIAHRILNWRIAHRIGKRGVMHIPNHQPARFSHEQARKYTRENGF